MAGKNSEMSASIKMGVDSKGVKDGSAKSQAELVKLRRAAEKEADLMKKKNKEVVNSIGDIGSAVGGTVGELTNLGTALMTAAGPLAAVVAIVGGLAMAWKTSKENVDLYLKSADKIKFGFAGFQQDTEAAREDALKRARGQRAAGMANYAFAFGALQRKDLTKSEKEALEIMLQQAEAQRDEGQALVESLRFNENKVKWGLKYNVLLQEQERLADEELIVKQQVAKLDETIDAQKAIATNKDSTALQISQASAEIEKAANSRMLLKQSLYGRQEKNLTALSELTATQEVNEDKINELIVSQTEAEEEYNKAVAKSNTMEKKSLTYAEKKSVELQKQAKAQQAINDSYKSMKPTASGNYDLGLGNMDQYGSLASTSEKPMGDLPTADDINKQNDEIKRKQLANEEEVIQKRRDTAAEWVQLTANALNVISDIMEQSKQRELSAAGNNAAKREEIEKKYRKRQQRMAIAQAIVNGALAITNMIANVPGSVINPATWVGIGIASASTAAQVAMIASQKFADGGIVSGTTLATVGEYAGAKQNPEVIAPLNKLKGMLGGQSVNVQVEGRLKGKDLALVLTRYNSDLQSNT